MVEQKSTPGSMAWLRAGVTLGIFVSAIALIALLDPDRAYEWIKAFHIMAIIAWMASLLYLPRLFIYHFQTQEGSEASELFKVMERRLYRIIMNPAMMLSWLAGLYMAWTMFGFHGGWLHLKLLSVVALTGVHIYFGRAVRAFQRDERPRNQRYWRILNEVPALLMIVIVIMVVLKPF